MILSRNNLISTNPLRVNFKTTFFFALHNPESLSLIRGLVFGLKYIIGFVEKENCDLSKGHWIREPRGSNFYTNSSCATIPNSKNCFKQGRMDMDFLNWRWKPDQCELPRFDAKLFLQIVQGKTMAFIGDSVARNHIESLLCLLSQVSLQI